MTAVATSERVRLIIRRVIRNGHQWQAVDHGYDDRSPQLPPAPPANDLEVCLAAPPAAFAQIHRCSRHVGHTGRHASYGRRRVLAVWSRSTP